MATGLRGEPCRAGPGGSPGVGLRCQGPGWLAPGHGLCGWVGLAGRASPSVPGLLQGALPKREISTAANPRKPERSPLQGLRSSLPPQVQERRTLGAGVLLGARPRAWTGAPCAAAA